MRRTQHSRRHLAHGRRHQYHRPPAQTGRRLQAHWTTANDNKGLDAGAQGVGNAVGMAIAGKMAAAHFNTPEHEIINHQVVCLAGDGCLQEGVAAEAASLAAHVGLDNLVLLYDSNDVTLDAMASATQSESVLDRFAAYGFEVERLEEVFKK